MPEATTLPPIDNLLADLKNVYEKRGESGAWNEESDIYNSALPLLIKELQGRYEIEKPLALGSTATVWLLKDTMLGQARALKLPRPRLSRLSDIVRVMRGERQKLAALNHQNIVKIYTAGELTFKKNEDEYSFPFFVMEFLPGVQDLSDFIGNSACSCSALDLVEHFRNILSGLAYLHEQGIVHCDVKPGNILIAPGRPALITDFGYAKHFPRPGNAAQKTQVIFTLQYGHPDLRQRIKDSTDKNATIAEIPRDDLKPQFDLYALGKTLLETLRTYIQNRAHSSGQSIGDFTPYQRQFVAIVAKRLLDGQVEHVSDDELNSDVVLGLAKAVMEEIKYKAPDEALGDLEKLLDLYSIEGDIPELNQNIGTYVQIPHCRVPLTDRVNEVINHPTFRRLAQVTQLGFVSLVYPGASHTRYEHVLGTFAHCCDYVRALWEDQRNPLFQCVMTRHDIELLLVAGLLHDLGQYPMAHDLTEVSSEFAHEQFGARLLESTLPGNVSLSDVVAARWGVELDELVSIWSATSESSFKHRLLNSIISGPLDCDKIDYVRRDSTHLGVTFGLALDGERLLRNITVAYAPDGKVIPEKMRIVGLAVAEKALVVAKSLVKIREDLFTQVYWHHTVRSLKAMLGFAVRNTLLWLSQEQNAESKEAFWRCFHLNVLGSFKPGQLCADSACAAPGAKATPEKDDDWLGAVEPASDDQASGLGPTDDSLLLFFRQFAQPRERAVIDAIRSRRIYKRVYALTWSREAEMYNQIYERFHTYRLDGMLNEIEAMRNNCETLVRAQLLSILDKELLKQPNDELKELRGRFETAEPLILLDVPVKAVSRGVEHDSIYYSQEEAGKAHDTPQLFVHPIALEQTPFDKEVGKIRIFAPPELAEDLVRLMPDHHETISGFLLR